MADVYEMMMKIGLSGGILTDLTIVAERLTRIHRLSEQVNQGFTGWHAAIMSAGLALTGGALITGAVKLVEHAKEFNKLMVDAKIAGGDMAALAATPGFNDKLYDVAKRTGMKVEDVLKIPLSTYSVAGGPESMRMMEPLAKYVQAQGGKLHEDALFSLIKGGEITGRVSDEKGQFSEEKLMRWLDLAMKIKNATHGTVDEAQLYGFAQQAGGSARYLTDEGMMTMAIIMQNMGGKRAGTAFMSTFQQLGSGTMLARTALGMQDLGLLKPEEWHNDHGKVVLHDDASKRLTKLLAEDPANLTAKILEAMEVRHINDPLDRVRKIMRISGRQTTARFLMEMSANRAQMMAERGRMEGGMGASGAFEERQAHDLGKNLDNLSNAWSNLFTAIGGPNAENFIGILKAMTGAIEMVTDKVRGMDPATIQHIVIGIGGIGVALIAMGAAGVVAGAIMLAPGAAVAVGVASLAAMLTMFGGLKPYLEGIVAISKYVTGWDATMAAIGKGIDTAMAIFQKINGFFNWMSEELSKLGSFLGPGPLHKSSFQGEGFGGAQLIPASFGPHGQKQVLQPIHMNLNIDGRTLAQAVSEVLEDLYTHDTGAAASNGWSRFRSVQGGYTST